MRNNGFTLLELIVTVALVAVLASMAIPSFRSTVVNNQLVSCANQLVAAIQLAKSEAVTSRQSIIVAADPAAAQQPAFRVGTDPDNNNSVEDVDLMQSFQCEGNNLTINPAPNVNFIRFGTTGFREDGQGQIVFTTCNELQSGRQLTVSNGGGITTNEAPAGACP